jgi:hypothetical protein
MSQAPRPSAGTITRQLSRCSSETFDPAGAHATLPASGETPVFPRATEDGRIPTDYGSHIWLLGPAAFAGREVAR